MRKLYAALACILTFPILGTSAETPPQPTAGGNPSIKWDPSGVTVKAAKETTEVSYKFTGKNVLPQYVKITKVGKSCGCTSIDLSTENLAPGETVTLQGKINIRASSGLQKKTITVLTDIGDPVVLTVTVDSPEGIKVHPWELIWTAPDMSTKEVVVLAPPETKLGEIKVISGKFKLEEKKDAKGVKLLLTPLEPSKGAVRVTGANESDIPIYIRLEYNAGAPKPGEGGQMAPNQPNPNQPNTANQGSQKEDIDAAKVLLKMALEKLDKVK